MSDVSTQDRLAALQARRSNNRRTPVDGPPAGNAPIAQQTAPSGRHAVLAETTTVLAETTAVLPSAGRSTNPPVDTAAHGLHHLTVPWNRVAAAGASVVSFAAMIVAMGPIFAEVETTEADTGDGDSGTAIAAGVSAQGASPVPAPAVAIEATPAADKPPTLAVGNQGLNPALSNQTATAPLADHDPPATPIDGQAAPLPSAAPAPPVQQPATLETATPQSGAPGTAPPQSAAPDPTPATQPAANPPQTAAPAPPPQTEPPATAAPTTAPPATQPPPPATEAPTTTTAPPTTNPPTTAPPTTAPATTPPPKSGGSGG